MRIFYGVQGTGIGHIARARVMAKALKKAGIHVDYQFSGRDPDKYFDNGVACTVDQDKVNYLKILLATKPITFIKEVRQLDLRDYDLVVSDFEPVTAWAAKTQNIPVIGIGHQYAFQLKTLNQRTAPIANAVRRYFAPVSKSIGLHWHHFGQRILPPIIDTEETILPLINNKILVYLPFEDTQNIIVNLKPFKHFNFHVYTANPIDPGQNNIICKPLSPEEFKKDFYNCNGIISHAEFELASEALHRGKKILVKPLHSQMDQSSNALTLKILGLGYSMNKFESKTIEHWLHTVNRVKVSYPETAHILVNWFKQGLPEMSMEFIETIWQKVEISHVN